MIVGRMPIATIFEPTSLAARSAALRLVAQLALELERGVAGQRPRRHVELDVVLRELGLVALVGDARAAPRALWKCGCMSASTRLSSISRPVIGRSNSNELVLSIFSKTSRFWRTFSR